MKNIALFALSISIFASCKKSTMEPAAVNKTQIDIVNTSYSQAALTVSSGTTVTWVNQDYMKHTVTATDSSFYSPALNHGESYQHTFSTKGTFNYKCEFHSIMKGQIVVN